MNKNPKKKIKNQLPGTPPNLQILPNHPNFISFYLLSPPTYWLLVNLLDKLKFLLGTIIWASLGVLTGGLLLVIFRNKGQLILDNTKEFLDYCSKSNDLVFFGAIGSDKTAILATLAH